MAEETKNLPGQENTRRPAPALPWPRRTGSPVTSGDAAAAGLPLQEQPLDQLDGALDAVAGGVDAHIVVDHVAPLPAGEKFIVVAVAAVHLLQKFPGGFFVHLVLLHQPLHPQLEGGVDVDAHMGDLVVGQDHVGAPPHDDEVLPLGHFTQQGALVEKDGLGFWEAVIAVELPHPLAQAPVLLHPHGVLIQVLRVGEAGVVPHVVLLGLQALQHLGEDLGVVVVDLQRVRQGEADVRAGAAVGAADADDQMVPGAEAVLEGGGGDGLVQAGQVGVQDVHRAEVLGELLDQLHDLVVLAHHPGAGLPVPDGAGHIADQAQLAAQVVAGVAAGVHHLGQVPDGVLPIGVEYPAQTGPQQAVHLRVQVVQAVRDLQNRLACIFHGACPPYRKKIRVSRMKMGMRHRRAQNIYPKKEGMWMPFSSEMDLTMKLGALPM